MRDTYDGIAIHDPRLWRHESMHIGELSDPSSEHRALETMRGSLGTKMQGTK